MKRKNIIALVILILIGVVVFMVMNKTEKSTDPMDYYTYGSITPNN